MLCSVMILTLLIGVSKEYCPLTCQCEYYPTDDTTTYYTSAKCSGSGNGTISHLDNTTKELEVSEVNDETLSTFLSEICDLISELPFLTDLTIRTSELVRLDVTAESLNWIRSLTLIDTELGDLPGMFSNLSALESLDLSRNGITAIERDSFRTLSALKTLNISANSLSSLSYEGLRGLHDLKCLDLSNNNLSSPGVSSFHDLSVLQYLNLSHNRLEVLEDTSFDGLLQLQQLDLSWNDLFCVEPGSLQLPFLTRLLLTGNVRLGKSRDAAALVGTGRKLQTVDAARTGLQQVPTALTPSIHSLRLADNDIQSVSCGDLDSYPLLQLLDLTGNALRVIEEDALGRLELLTILYFTENNIREVPKSLPEKLKALHLERNEIETVFYRDLQALTELEVLLLNDNKISVIEEGAFSHSFSLASLDLSRNPVINLTPGSLTGPRALQVLRLSSMRIVSPGGENSFPLTTPDSLVILDLSDSPGLARRILADTAALAASKQLQELDLSGTNLALVRSDLLHFLPQLRTLHIKRNRLNCSQLHWLGSWLRRLDEHEYRDVLCDSPPEMWGMALIDIQEEESITADNVARTTYSSIVAGSLESSETVTKVRNHFDGPSEVAINGSLTPSERGGVTAQNANESVEAPSNRAHQGLASRDLFIGHEEQTLNNRLAAVKANGGERTIDLSVGEMSKYVNDKQTDGFLLHSGSLILAAGVLAVAGCVSMLAVRFVRGRRLYRREDIEVASLPTVSDLW